MESLASLQHAVMLEPDNWSVLFRHAVGSAGEERFRAARRTLQRCPHFPQAHWLVASVEVARNACDRAEREIDTARDAIVRRADAAFRFLPVGIHWMKARLCYTRGADDDALVAWGEELALEDRGQIYARECCANAWCDIAALQWRRGNMSAVVEACRQALKRVPRHPVALAVLASLPGSTVAWSPADTASRLRTAGMPVPFELDLAHAVACALDRRAADAAAYLADTLTAAPHGVAGWQIPIDPWLRVWDDPDLWQTTLHIVARRAS